MGKQLLVVVEASVLLEEVRNETGGLEGASLIGLSRRYCTASFAMVGTFDGSLFFVRMGLLGLNLRVPVDNGIVYE